MAEQSPARRVAVFVAFLCAGTLIAHMLLSQVQGSSSASALVMVSPALAALAASAMTRRSWRDIGWRVRPVTWLALGWMLPILYAIPAYGMVWISGLGGVPNPTFLERARLTLDMASGSDGTVILAAFVYITIVNLIPSVVLSLGEEIGWRGFLVPELTKWVGLRKAGIFSGVLWAAWHLPGILSGSYGAAGTPRVFQIACFTAMVVATGVIMAWLRMKSGSILPAAIMHATHNGLVQAFLDRITFDTGATRYLIGEFGAALIPFTVLAAWYAWHHSGRSDAVTTSDALGRDVVRGGALAERP